MWVKIIIISALAIILTGCGKQSTVVNVNVPVADIEASADVVVLENINQPNTSTTNNNSNPTPTTPPPAPVKIEIPAKLELDVDFAPQAPFGNWNELHEEACEEASMVTVAKYFLNLPLDDQVMDNELVKIDAWEKDHGYKIDLSASEVATVLQQYFKVNSKVVSDVSVDRIKYELSLGHLIIVPAAGRELQNPYFRSPGPIYHMLVIKGYNSSEFIVNEVGTKRGDSFKYKYQTLIDAVHDWNPTWSHYEVTDDQMESQPKKMVVVSK